MKKSLLLLVAPLAAGASANSKDFPALGLSNLTRLGVSDNGLDARGINGPYVEKGFPDPCLIWGDGSWKAYATSSNGKRVPVAESSDAKSWELTVHDALPDPGSWVNPKDKSVWAPDVQKNDDGVYVMYYTAHKEGGSHCIGAATSETAIGPFKPQESPIICDDENGGVIDASGYDDGVDRWIVWKVDGNSLGGATTCQGGKPSGDYKSTPIKIQKMKRDALTLEGPPKQILDNEGKSNNGVVEAPVLYKVSDKNFVLFYSAHCYSTDDYDIEYAWSSEIDGSYTNRGILIRSVDNEGVWAPGGIDLDPNGRSIVFHGRPKPNGQGARELWSAELSISGHSIDY
ncbi:glycoside hydrolase family 43 protein [Xylaria sp. CBS 124048]|nr:glycoside hydrolase family 43 protein [Xylaria sp. CBS 124048]